MGKSKYKLRHELFIRDGWQDRTGDWYAKCSFGCGTVVARQTATIDRYPVMGRHGGRYILANTRLACAPCNSRNCNSNAVKPPHIDDNEDYRRERLMFRTPEYPESTKRKLRENYPRAAGRDANGINIGVYE